MAARTRAVVASGPSSACWACDAGRLAQAGQALDRVAAGQRPGPRGVPRVPQDVGPDMHGR